MAGIENPVNLQQARGQTEDLPLHTIAAYLVSRTPTAWDDHNLYNRL